MRRTVLVGKTNAVPLPAIWEIGSLTAQQVFELMLGVPGGFRSEAEARAAYAAHREQLIDATNPGARPVAFWKYEPAVPQGLRDNPEPADFDDLDRLIAAEELLEKKRVEWLLHNREYWKPGESEELFRWILNIREQNLRWFERK
ncbi:MAG: hypothetical protein KatS3mg081_0550 [Gemmatimonadales bacterium]|nr:MAG: hypothetical protein KatS3mg081_0550 [Gemmatimonadales bacterium]